MTIVSVGSGRLMTKASTQNGTETKDNAIFAMEGLEEC